MYLLTYLVLYGVVAYGLLAVWASVLFIREKSPISVKSAGGNLPNNGGGICPGSRFAGEKCPRGKRQSPCQ